MGVEGGRAGNRRATKCEFRVLTCQSSGARGSAGSALQNQRCQSTIQWWRAASRPSRVTRKDPSEARSIGRPLSAPVSRLGLLGGVHNARRNRSVSGSELRSDRPSAPSSGRREYGRRTPWVGCLEEGGAPSRSREHPLTGHQLPVPAESRARTPAARSRGTVRAPKDPDTARSRSNPLSPCAGSILSSRDTSHSRRRISERVGTGEADSQDAAVSEEPRPKRSHGRLYPVDSTRYLGFA